MQQRSNLSAQPIQFVSLTKRMLIGGSIALLVIVIFLSGTGEPNPEWGKLWMIRPLVIVPIAGAFGGAFSVLMIPMVRKGGMSMILAFILSILAFIIAVWLGVVLGLDGTYWD